MSWTTNAYCTRAQVKLALDIQADDQDSFLDELIPEAQAEIDAELGYSFQQDVSGTRLYSGNDTDTLLIDDLITLTSVTDLDTDEVITSDVVLGPDNTSPGFKLIRETGTWNAGNQNYQVVGTWGQPSVPADIRRATVRLVVHMYKLQQAAYGATGTTSYGKAKYLSDWPDDVCRIVERHRHRVFYS
jgi:hypothetical protein